jgi:hypothetical protein
MPFGPRPPAIGRELVEGIYELVVGSSWPLRSLVARRSQADPSMTDRPQTREAEHVGGDRRPSLNARTCMKLLTISGRFQGTRSSGRSPGSTWRRDVSRDADGFHAGPLDHGRYQGGRVRGARRETGDGGRSRGALRYQPRGTEKLLFVLAGAGYLGADDSGYALTPVSSKWLLRESRHSIADKLLFHFWDLLERAEDYVRTGEPVELHSMSDEEQWDLYQRGMRAMANATAGEAVRRIPVPKDAKRMLDIGGSRGYYSVALCRRHQELRSVILDLPQAVKHAAPLLAAEGMGERVLHRAGDALTADLDQTPTISSLAHSLSTTSPTSRTEPSRPGWPAHAPRRCRRDPRRVPATEREGRRPTGRPARVLFRAHEPGGHLASGGDLGLAASSGPKPAPSDSLTHGAGRRNPSGCQTRLGALLTAPRSRAMRLQSRFRSTPSAAQLGGGRGVS